MLPCTNLYIPILLIDSGYTANDTQTYEVIVPLLTIPDTDSV